MKTGVLIYSFDTPVTSYRNLTTRCVEHVNHHLKLPVTVVSDKQFPGVNTVVVEPKKGNMRSYQKETVPWYNLERTSAYEHSPYDTTILMDCDYFVMSDYLSQLSNTVNNILVHTKVNDITKRNNINHSREALIPLVWATVVIFKKNDFTQQVFHLIKHVQKNYQYYRKLYRILHMPYRNDYAFAIALHQMYGGRTTQYSMPTAMNMIGADSNILSLDMYSMYFSWNKQCSRIYDQDVHVFNKDIIDV